jgi:8-oxo-dGTP pyrophosphatase MutT (NUDIX family)
MEKIWSPEITDESRQSMEYSPGKGKKIAAVLIPIVLKQSGLTVILTQRAAHLNDHAGQISFPGGRYEESDQNIEHTAIREAHEEIGLHPSKIETLGHLPDYLTITGYQVTPVVSLVSSSENLVPDKNEVADIFEVPLSFLMNPANHQIRRWVGPNGTRRFYAMPYESKFIWGATAGMIRNLYHFLSA